ncbi:MAG: preprotein translocase subunit SecA [Planctomycetes bacterium]|nr:preprotein translocase subunit SecA [Planctomycetota bacterium]
MSQETPTFGQKTLERLESLGEFLQRFPPVVVRTLKSVFGSHNERVLRVLYPLVERINALEPEMVRRTDAELKAGTARFRERLAHGEMLDDLLPEAFAAVREAAKRVLRTKDSQPMHMRHFDVQLIGGIILHQGKIAEMVTGEGKTLVATLPAYLNALEGRGVHVVTVNDYLARRDRDWMEPLFDFLGMTVGAIQSNMLNSKRQQMYACDVTYGTNNEFGFDYLRDHMKPSLESQVQRGRRYAIVDEVDSVLIDEARTPLIISGPTEESTDKYYKAHACVKRLKGMDKNEWEQLTEGHEDKSEFEQQCDYVYSEKDHSVMMTERGIVRAQESLNVDDFYTGRNIDWPHFLEQAIRAKEIYKKDVDYVVKDGGIVIVDEFTGRLMEGRRWSDGLHQAIEAKEHLRIKEENQTLATITFQNFFKLYDKIAGMTGTAMTEGAEFFKIYKLEVVAIPPNKPLRRIEHADFIFGTSKEKYRAIEEEIVEVHETGRPILVGTISIERSEMLSERLRRRGIEHEVLNARHHEREAQIIALAGQNGRVTIATNMAGRGTDIVLGPGVAELGGLHIVGTERHEARRIDNQLRGRSGRQGDPGSSRFFLSLEDDLMRRFASDRMRSLMQRFGLNDGQPIESNLVSRSIARAQKRVEEYHFEIRKNLQEYDEVMNEQRKLIYGLRQEFLQGRNMKETLLEWSDDCLSGAIDHFLPGDPRAGEWQIPGLCQWFKRKFTVEVAPADLEGKSSEAIQNLLLQRVRQKYEERERAEGPENMRTIERFLLLETMDTKWKDHLYSMDMLRAGIGLRGYGQVDPKIVYKKEGYEIFEEMYNSMKDEVGDYLFRVRIAKEEAQEILDQNYHEGQAIHEEFQGQAGGQTAAAAGSTPERLEPQRRETPRVKRNDPCPCNSGKKYKNCCMLKDSIA